MRVRETRGRKTLVRLIPHGPLKTQLVDNSRDLLSHQVAQKTFYLALQEALDRWDGIECAADFYRVDGVVAEDQGQSFLFGEDEDYDAREEEVGQPQEHGHGERRVCCQDPAGGEVRGKSASGIQWIRLQVNYLPTKHRHAQAKNITEENDKS